jgi:hypothetical protein
MDKVEKRSNSECYTPSSEPFRIYYFPRVENMFFVGQLGKINLTFKRRENVARFINAEIAEVGSC